MMLLVGLVVAMTMAHRGCVAFAPPTAYLHQSGAVPPLTESPTSSSSSLHSTSGTNNNDFFQMLQDRFQLFQSSLDEYDFKQSMAIAIAGGDYDSDQIQRQIEEVTSTHPCVMYSWESSPSCKKAVTAFDTMNESTDKMVNVKIVRLDDPWSEGNKVRAELGKMTGKSSVPSVWIGGEYVGGYDSGVSDEAPGLVGLAFQGKLWTKLEDAGAIVDRNELKESK